MAFKMKGPSLYRKGNGNMADGRSKSAAVQMKSPMKQTDIDPWVAFLNETKQEDYLNEDGSLNVEAHREAINNSLIRNGLKEKPEGWVDPLELGEAAATGAGEFVGEEFKTPNIEQGIGEQFTTQFQQLIPVRTKEEILQEIKDVYGEAYFDMDQKEIDYIIEQQMKMDAEGTEGEVTFQKSTMTEQEKADQAADLNLEQQLYLKQIQEE